MQQLAPGLILALLLHTAAGASFLESTRPVVAEEGNAAEPVEDSIQLKKGDSDGRLCQDIGCAPGWKAGWKGSNRCYKFGKARVNFQGAQNWCALQGASLVSINSAKENRFVSKSCGLTNVCWLGLSEYAGDKSTRKSSQKWVWVDGTNVAVNAYSNWDKAGQTFGEPNNGKTSRNGKAKDERRATMKGGKWSDSVDSYTARTVCEKVMCSYSQRSKGAREQRPPPVSAKKAKAANAAKAAKAAKAVKAAKAATAAKASKAARRPQPRPTRPPVKIIAPQYKSVAKRAAPVTAAPCATSTQTATFYCPPSWFPWSGRCYYITPQPMSCSGAALFCRQRGADLVAINSVAENSYVTQICGASNTCWVGLIEKAGTGDMNTPAARQQWVWTDGSTPAKNNFSSWHGGKNAEPNNGRPVTKNDERCTLLKGSKWFDAPNAFPARAACEMVSSAVLTTTTKKPQPCTTKATTTKQTTTATTKATVFCPPYWYEHSGNCFKTNKYATDHNSAETWCTQQGKVLGYAGHNGTLASINNAKENAYLSRLCGRGETCWIGLKEFGGNQNTPARHQQWAWPDGSTPRLNQYSQWHLAGIKHAEPNNGFPLKKVDERYVFFRSAKWFDAPNEVPARALCEIKGRTAPWTTKTTKAPCAIATKKPPQPKKPPCATTKAPCAIATKKPPPLPVPCPTAKPKPKPPPPPAQKPKPKPQVVVRVGPQPVRPTLKPRRPRPDIVRPDAKPQPTKKPLPPLQRNGCPKGWLKNRGQCYKVQIAKANFPASRLWCQGQQADLVTISDAVENDFLWRICGTGTLNPILEPTKLSRQPCWLGLVEKPSTGNKDTPRKAQQWVWVDGTVMKYNNWKEWVKDKPNDPNNEPNNGAFGKVNVVDERFAVFNQQSGGMAGRWYDMPPTYTGALAVCKKPVAKVKGAVKLSKIRHHLEIMRNIRMKLPAKADATEGIV